jgi:hypothetical protein
MAVARELMPHEPAQLIISGLTRAEAEQGGAELEQDPARQPERVLEAAGATCSCPTR